MNRRSTSRGRVRYRKLLAVIMIISILTGILPVFPVYAGIDTEPSAQMHANGEFVVYVLNGSEWEEVGSLSFDKFLQEKQMDLSDFVPTEETVKVKLAKSGGGAAHLDSVFLGGAAAIAVNGEEGQPLAKLSKKDLDIISAGENGTELTFDLSGRDMVLAVTARIESTNISKTPFQFPRENMYKVMDENSSFYTYSLSSGGRSLALGDMLDAVDGQEPFYREYVVPGSGHPPGDIYGWVMNDGQNLYVAQEFTPDNTVDGNKDYAKVYVLTGDGLREFKVTESEETWGKAYFTYTDKVGYQHKFYEFIIPLSEIGIAEGDTRDIQIAFGAYGTMAPSEPQKRYPALAYNSQENNYLCVYSYVDPDSGWWTEKIKGELVAADGTVIPGSQFTINDYDDCFNQLYPAVAYDSVNNRYLVVWMRYTWSGYKLYGQLVNADGTLEEELMLLSDSSSSPITAAVAYDSTNRKFLVTWDHKDTASPYHQHIYGRFVNADTDGYGPEFTISDSLGSGHDTQRPAVTFDSHNDKFLVVWDDNRQNLGIVNSDIYGQFVNYANTGEELVGSNFEIAAAPNSQAYSSVAYDSENHKYMVAWQDYRNLDTSNEDIYGCIMGADDTDDKVELEISEDSLTNEDDFPQWRPTVVYGNGSTGFWVAWKHVDFDGDGGWVGEPQLRGRLVAADGGMSDTINSNPGPTTDNVRPATAFNSTDSSFLNASEWFEEDGFDLPVEIAYWLIETESSPRVLSAVPANNATGVARDAEITINFSEEVTQSVNFSDIRITTGSTVVDYDYDGVGGTTLILTPKELFAYGTAYTVTIPANAVKDAENNGLASSYSFSFTVLAAPSGNPSGGGPANNTPPASPLKLRLVSDNPAISLVWDKNKESDLAGYNIYRKERGGSTSKKLNSAILTSEEYRDESTKTGVTYIYYVTAVDRAGNESGKSNEVEAALDNIRRTILFSDVPSDSWCSSSAARLTSIGAIHGYPDGTFRPEKNITRAEFAKILVLAMGWKLEDTSTASFPDVNESYWANRYIETGKAHGVLHGYKDGFFRPDNNISRGEIAKIMAMNLRLTGDASNLTDIDLHWAKDYINSCVKVGIVEGYGDRTFRPNNPATRCEAAKMIAAMIDYK